MTAGRATLPRELGRLVASIERTPIATVVSDPRRPDNPIIAANRAFVELTGYSRTEVLGRNCRFLAGPATDPAAQDRLRSAIAQGKSAMVELVNYRKDRRAFRNAVMIAPILDETGSPVLFIGSQMDVGEAGLGLEQRHVRAAGLIGLLTPRQREVLKFLVRGHRNKQIAAALGIGETTVKMHRAAMLVRLGCGTSAEAIRLGVEGGLSEG